MIDKFEMTREWIKGEKARLKLNCASPHAAGLDGFFNLKISMCDTILDEMGRLDREEKAKSGLPDGHPDAVPGWLGEKEKQ